jgi:hypothetical protein
MPNTLRKTVLLAIATLMLAVAALVTDMISPYTGGIDSASAANQQPAKPQLRPEQNQQRMQA